MECIQKAEANGGMVGGIDMVASIGECLFEKVYGTTPMDPGMAAGGYVNLYEALKNGWCANYYNAVSILYLHV